MARLEFPRETGLILRCAGTSVAAVPADVMEIARSKEEEESIPDLGRPLLAPAWGQAISGYLHQSMGMLTV